MATEQQLDEDCKRKAREEMCKLPSTDDPNNEMDPEEKKYIMILKLRYTLMASRGVAGIKGIGT